MKENKFIKYMADKWNDNSIADSVVVKRASRKVLYNAFLASLIIGLCFAILYPLLKILPVVFNNIEALGNPDVIWIPTNYSLVSFQAAIRLVFGNGLVMVQSLGYAGIIAAIQVFMCAMAGYVLGRIKIPGGNIILFIVVLTFMVPPQSLLISQYLTFKHFDVFGILNATTGNTIDLINKPYTLYIIAILGFGVKQSLFVFIFRQFFKSLPSELEEAALIDGCGFYKTYFKVVLPNAVPAIMTVLILSFVWNYGDTYYTGYFHPDGPYLSNILTKTFMSSNVSMVLSGIKNWFDAPGATTFAFDAVKQAGALIYLIPLLIIYFLAQKKFVENLQRSGIVG